MKTCIFCNIAQGQVPTSLIYEDKQVVAFDDLAPQAPHHKLIIPRQHIATLNELHAEHEPLIGHMVWVAKQLAGEVRIAEDGYRILMNCNAEGGQAVYHIHLHLLGGRTMHWPPG